MAFRCIFGNLFVHFIALIVHSVNFYDYEKDSFIVKNKKKYYELHRWNSFLLFIFYFAHFMPLDFFRFFLVDLFCLINSISKCYDPSSVTVLPCRSIITYCFHTAHRYIMYILAALFYFCAYEDL